MEKIICFHSDMRLQYLKIDAKNLVNSSRDPWVKSVPENIFVAKLVINLQHEYLSSFYSDIPSVLINIEKNKQHRYYQTGSVVFTYNNFGLCMSKWGNFVFAETLVQSHKLNFHGPCFYSGTKMHAMRGIGVEKICTVDG
jgi:hypothetical protein